MSNLSTQVFGDMNYLYEHIANRDAQQLNENSDHYDEEATELVVDILATISSSMVCEGYSANAIITFLATSSEQDIIEKYLSFDENILTENTISEDYIIEQLEIFDFAINEGWADKIATGAVKGALKLAGRIASKPARMKVAQKIMTSKDPTKTAAAVDRLARMKLNKAGMPSDMTKNLVDKSPNLSSKTAIAAVAPTMGKVVKGALKVKDLAKGAKAALTSPTAKKIGLGVAGLGAVGGAGAIGGAIGAKMAGGNGQGPSPSNAKPSPSSTDDFMKGSALAKLGGREGRIKDGEFRSMNWSQQSKDRYNQAKGSSTPPAPKPPAPAPSVADNSGSGSGGSGSGGSGSGRSGKPTATPSKKPAVAKLGNTSFERRTPTSAELRAAQTARAGGEKDAEKVLQAAQKTNLPTTGPTPAIPDLKSVNADLKKANSPEELKKPAPAGSALAAEQERRKKTEAQKQTVSSSYEYDAYDLVLEYLFDNGHADTIAEAEYVMSELDESFIQSLVETYHANLLAEEVEAWVNELVNEGYDLSEYTWDDMVEHYFS